MLRWPAKETPFNSGAAQCALTTDQSAWEAGDCGRGRRYYPTPHHVSAVGLPRCALCVVCVGHVGPSCKDPCPHQPTESGAIGARTRIHPGSKCLGNGTTGRHSRQLLCALPFHSRRISSRSDEDEHWQRVPAAPTILKHIFTASPARQGLQTIPLPKRDGPQPPPSTDRASALLCWGASGAAARRPGGPAHGSPQQPRAFRTAVGSGPVAGWDRQAERAQGLPRARRHGGRARRGAADAGAQCEGKGLGYN